MDYTFYTPDGDYAGPYSNSGGLQAADLPQGFTAIPGTHAATTRLVDGEVTDFSASEVQAYDDASTAQAVRTERDRLLRSTDFTVLPDAPFTAEQQTAYRTYRQALRDLPGQSGFPNTVIYPTRPS